MRTDREIIEQTNELARRLYALRGYVVAEGYRFDQSHHPRAREAWEGARAAQLILTDTDPNDALGEDEEGCADTDGSADPEDLQALAKRIPFNFQRGRCGMDKVAEYDNDVLGIWLTKTDHGCAAAADLGFWKPLGRSTIRCGLLDVKGPQYRSLVALLRNSPIIAQKAAHLYPTKGGGE